MTPEEEIIDTAKDYAIECHESTNHRYNWHPYAYHLKMVYDYGRKYGYQIPEHMRPYVLSACYTHDTIEDTRQTLNDVRDVCGETIAEITYALTNEKGRNRKERANAKYYEGIRNTPYATLVKLCDRLANVSYSKDNGSSMLKKYRDEQAYFKEALFVEGEYTDMWNELNELLNF